MSYKDEHIRISSSIPSLNDRIYTRFRKDGDLIYWYIKFNIFLNEKSVSNKTMSVTDTEGYIMETEISYNSDKNIIIISPIDSYEQDVFYILNISKKVCSQKGKYLKREINILFKLLNNQISEFRVLKPNTKLPKSKKRDKHYYEKLASKTKVYSFQKNNDLRQFNLPYINFKINLILGIIAILITIVSIFVKNIFVVILSIIFAVLGIVHITGQLRNKKMRSIMSYNFGVFAFNKEKYKKAQNYFIKSFELDNDNEYAEYAITKVKYYI